MKICPMMTFISVINEYDNDEEENVVKLFLDDEDGP